MFRAVVFAVHDAGFVPRCSLELSDATQNRLVKIEGIITECRYGIHDISRTERFLEDLPVICDELGHDLEEIPFIDYSEIVLDWLAETAPRG